MKIKTIFGLACIAIGANSFADDYGCKFNYTPGWTGSLSVTCDKDVDLTSNPISFDVVGGQVSSVWGNNYVKLSSDGKSLEFSKKVKSWWDPTTQGPTYEDYVLSAGSSLSISLGVSPNTSLNNIHIGAVTPAKQGTLQITIDPKSDPISNATVTVTDKDGKTAATATWEDGSKPISIPLPVADGYKVQVAVKNDDGTTSDAIVEQSTPINITENNTSNVSVIYKKDGDKTQVTFNLVSSLPTPNIKSMNVNIKDNTNNTTSNITLPLTSTVSVSVKLTTGHSYTFSADKVTTDQIIYNPAFNPQQINNISGNIAPIQVYYIPGAPIKTTSVTFNTTGLIQGVKPTINLHNNTTNSDTSVNLDNPTTNTKDLQDGSYSLTSSSVTYSGNTYSLSNTGSTTSFNIPTADNTNIVNLAYTSSPNTSGKVKGWPNYIAMGAITDANYTNTSQLKDRYVDSIFKYAGDGGNGDRGQITYPIYTQNTYKLANELTNINGNKVLPVMVVYTAEMSGGTNFDDFTNTNDGSGIDQVNNLILTKHFINLMLLSQTMEAEHKRYASEGNDINGSMVINPDLMGMVQQQKLYTTLLDSSYHMDVSNALKEADWFVNTKHTWNLKTPAGLGFTVPDMTPSEVVQAAENGDFKKEGIYSPWDIKSSWVDNSYEILSQYKETDAKSSNIPTFENNFKGWVQATNWLIHHYSNDSITFGWQENVWNQNSATWVHNNYSDTQIESTITNPTVKLWNDAGLYNGEYKPDFLVFDKYERNPIPGEMGSGYIWNNRDWDNYMTYVKQMSQDLNNIPVMLWQIPGGHMQINGETQMVSAATGPDYFLGNPDVSANLSNIMSYISNINLNSNTYNCGDKCSFVDYMINNGYDWHQSNMQKAKDSNVFAILWGKTDH